MASPVRFSLNGTTDSNGSVTLRVDPRALPGSAQIWNAYIDVVGQLAVIQCQIGEDVVAQANGTSPALGPVYSLPYEVVTFIVTTATPATQITVTLTGYYSDDVNDLPSIAAPPQNLQGPIVGSGNLQTATYTAPAGNPGSVFTRSFPLGGFSGFFLQVQKDTGFPTNDIIINVQFYSIDNQFIAQQTWELNSNVATMIGIIPMLGDHVAIQFQNWDNVNANTFNIWLQPFQQMPPFRFTNDRSNLINFAGASVAGGGGVVEIFCGFVFDGSATLTFYTGSTTYNAILRAWAHAGTFTLWQSVNSGAATATTANLTLPRYPLSLRFVNNGGSAVTPVFNLTAGE